MNHTDLSNLIAKANKMVEESEKHLKQSDERVSKILSTKTNGGLEFLNKKYYQKTSQVDEKPSEILNTTTDSDKNSIIIKNHFTKRPRTEPSLANCNLYKNQEMTNQYTSVQKKNQVTIDKPIELKNEISTKSFGNKVSTFFRNLFWGGKKKVSSISH